MIPNFRGEYSYNMVYPFPGPGAGASIAGAGGTGTTDQRTQDGRYYFIGTHFMGTVYLATAAVAGTSIAGTPLIDVADPSPPAAVGNIVPSTSLINVQYYRGSLGDSDVARPWAACMGTAKFPLIVADEIVLFPLQQSYWALTNNTAAANLAVAGCIVIMGRQVPKDQYESWLNTQRK